MKKILFLLAMMFCLCSCESDMEKAEKIIDRYMFENLLDYESYQPISSEWKIEGYKVIHKFRCKTAGGISKINTWYFALSLEKDEVSFVTDENDELLDI